ncbi:MAG: 2-oxoacid:acceptor oxidoreductase family protein [Candidatus Hydrogenedentota bacterium]
MQSSAGVTNGVLEIRWHGRGGQGAISSARILAEAAYRGGCLGVTSAPSFGAERRGAPVTASTRLSEKPLRIFSQIETPDMVVVLDESLLTCANPLAGLAESGMVIVNSRQAPDTLGLPDDIAIVTADATGAAKEAGLVVSGTIMVNTAMLGAVVRVAPHATLETLWMAFEASFPPDAARVNYEAARLTYERTQCNERAGEMCSCA